MEFIIILVVILAPLLSSVEVEPKSRKEELYEVLDHAVILHKSTSRYANKNTKSDESRELDLDMAHLEMMGGYLSRTCVYETDKVLGLRAMKAYISMMRLLRYSDPKIEQMLINRAGKHGEAVEKLLDFAGLDGIGHFICQDYMRARLRDGMRVETLKAYIDEIPDDEGDERRLISLEL